MSQHTRENPEEHRRKELEHVPAKWPGHTPQPPPPAATEADRELALEIRRCLNVQKATSLITAHRTAAVAAAVKQAESERDGLIRLVAELDAYWAWVWKENEGCVSMAHIHGWRCSQEVIDKGEAWRAKIAALRSGERGGE